MIKNQFFQKHYVRLILEAVLKSALCGLAIGFGANFLAALAAWLFSFGGVWFAIGIGAGAAVISGVLFYFLRFRPDTTEIARRVDRLGLEERLVTMLELEGDDSYIATLQRENTKEHLEDVKDRRIRLRIPRVAVVLLSVALVLGSGMTTVVVLAEQDILKEGNELFPEDPLADHIPVTYLVEGGGEIEGETDQLVMPGGSTEPVVAVPEEDWVFVGWDDGQNDPERQETNVTEEMVFIAIFEQIVDGGEDGDEGESDNSAGGEEGDKADDVPGGGEANVESDQSGDAGNKGDGSGSSGDSEGGQGTTNEEGEGKGDGQGLGAGGKWEDSNQFIDGKTYYRDHLEMYYEMAQQIFEENGEIPPELREFFETYFDSI